MWSSLCKVSLLFLVLGLAQGGILSNVFGDNMVLQRAPVSSSLFGWSSGNDSITVVFNGARKYNAIAAGDGYWEVALDPTPAGGPFTFIIASSANASATVNLTNVLFGDVLLCGGQSNMQFTVNVGFNASYELDRAGNYSNIRLFTVGQVYTSSTPMNELGSIEQTWSVASKDSLGASASAFGYFSAVCWFTAININEYNPGLPIGLVSSNWGGTIIQAWSSPDALSVCPQSTVEEPAATTFKSAASPHLYVKEGVEVVGPGPNVPTALWNAMIVPFLNMKLAGFLWYQAEANVGQTDLYRCLFPAMINDWRVKWGLGNLPFFFAQLAPYTTDGPLPYWYSLADMRLAQAYGGLSLPRVALISTIDAGDLTSPFTNIHPRNKQIVGYRMALAAKALLYEVPDVVHSGPTIVDATITSNFPSVNIIVTFVANTIGDGLVLQEAACPTLANFTQYCSTFEIGLSDGSWHVATATVYQTVALQLVLASPVNATALTVSGIRYLYNDWPVATLYSSSSGLPASPFYYTFIQ